MVESLLVTYGLGGGDQVKTLKAAGAVGDVIGHFLDADGNIVDHPLNRRTVAISLEDLRGIRKVVLVAGGRKKIDIMRAALDADGDSFWIDNTFVYLGAENVERFLALLHAEAGGRGRC
jgi:DNA-binding transcriptional regulator LsrR (DeoR family)